jgi:hypothetical protein
MAARTADRRAGSRSTKVGVGDGESRDSERERELASNEKSLPPTLSCFTVPLSPPPPPPPSTVPIVLVAGARLPLVVLEEATTFLQTGQNGSEHVVLGQPCMGVTLTRLGPLSTLWAHSIFLFLQRSHHYYPDSRYNIDTGVKHLRQFPYFPSQLVGPTMPHHLLLPPNLAFVAVRRQEVWRGNRVGPTDRGGGEVPFIKGIEREF